MAPYKNLIAISGACPLRIGIVALDPSQWATRFGQRSTVIMHSALHCRLRKTGEGGIRTLGSLLGYGALAKRRFNMDITSSCHFVAIIRRRMPFLRPWLASTARFDAP
jgi:hypothetical protein